MKKAIIIGLCMAMGGAASYAHAASPGIVELQRCERLKKEVDTAREIYLQCCADRRAEGIKDVIAACKKEHDAYFDLVYGEYWEFCKPMPIILQTYTDI